MNSGPTLSIGATGADVRRLQTIFVMTKELDYASIDGNFGPKTQDAVKLIFDSSGRVAARKLLILLVWGTDFSKV